MESMTMSPMTGSNLFKALMLLVKQSDSFFFKDFPSECPELNYRIFNYRLAGYSEWLQPGALESRGSMFLVRGDEFVKLICRPPRKFFNYGENPFTMGLDMSEPTCVMHKEDGSIMSTYVSPLGELKLKSRGSIGSTQAIDAQAFLDNPDHAELKRELMDLAEAGYTTNMEWVAPWNRVVIGYQRPDLRIFSIIENETGTVHLRDFAEMGGYIEIRDWWVDDYIWVGDDLVEYVKGSVGQEGIVAISNNGTWVKVKSDWYLNLHQTKDSITNSKALIGVILAEGSDDLKSMFSDDEWALKKIEVYEKVISKEYNQRMMHVEKVHSEIGSWDRKDYMIRAKESEGEFPGIFGALVGIYLGRDYSELIKGLINKNYKQYIIDEFESPSEESEDA